MPLAHVSVPTANNLRIRNAIWYLSWLTSTPNQATWQTSMCGGYSSFASRRPRISASQLVTPNPKPKSDSVISRSHPLIYASLVASNSGLPSYYLLLLMYSLCCTSFSETSFTATQLPGQSYLLSPHRKELEHFDKQNQWILLHPHPGILPT